MNDFTPIDCLLFAIPVAWMAFAVVGQGVRWMCGRSVPFALWVPAQATVTALSAIGAWIWMPPTPEWLCGVIAGLALVASVAAHLALARGPQTRHFAQAPHS